MLPSTGTALEKAAQTEYQAGRYARAGELFAQAAEQFLAEGEPLRCAENHNNHSVALLQGGDAQAALQAVLGTEETFAQAGDRHRQALALGNQAAALQALGRAPEALAVYQRAGGLLSETGDQGAYAIVMQRISELQLKSGRQFEALASMRASLARKEKLSVKEKLLKKLLEVPLRMLQ
jgi:tetratricopeptide (TPR) repeat protein